MIEQILVILLAIIINGWITYYITYFKKKGEYKVLKEDIEEITEKVEYIKTQFQRETDKIKSELEYLTQRKLSIASEELNAILNFYEKYSIWLNKVLDIPTYNMSSSKIEEYRVEIDKTKIGYETAESRLGIFLDDEEFFSIKTDLNIKTIEIQSIAITCLLKMANAFNEAELYKAYRTMDFNEEEYQVILNKSLDAYRKYSQEKLEKFPTVRELEVTIRRILREKLYEIMSEK